MKKWLVAAKVFTEKVSVNTFNVDDIDQLFHKFDLNKGTGQEYKVVIVGLNDMNMPKPTGTGFAWKNRTESLDWWQNETRTNSPFAWPNSLRIETHLCSQESSLPLPKGVSLSAAALCLLCAQNHLHPIV